MMHVRKYLSLHPFAISSLLIVTFFAPVFTAENKYCSFTPEHTLCKYTSTKPSANCGTTYAVGVPPEDSELITNIHNLYRAQVASGRELRGYPGPQPTASNMKELVWDDELAAIAQRLAIQCKFNHDCPKCRRVSRYYYIGQNLGESSESIRRPSSNWAQPIKQWYDEVTKFSRNDVQSFELSQDFGKYTQMVWADTDRIGCGYIHYRAQDWHKKFYICNYGPSGNFNQKPMYLQGPPSSACPQGTTRSVKYPALCSESQLHRSAIVFPESSPNVVFQASSMPLPTIAPTPRPSTKQVMTINETESNDLQFEYRSNFPIQN